jgi:hypothetical protein
MRSGMKKTRSYLFGLGILAALFAGCFNPITVRPPENVGDHSFTINMVIGQDDQARTVIGPNAARIKGKNILNFIQLIVVDTETKEIVAFAEKLRKDDEDNAATLTINALPFHKIYAFLFLMGHWERDYPNKSNGDYNYKDGPPTLLVAGLEEKLITDSKTLSVIVWPIIVDTEFTTRDAAVPMDSRSKQPEVNAATGKIGTVNLHKGDWNVTWTIKCRDTGESDGLAELIEAQRIRFPEAGAKLLLKSKKTILRGEDRSPLEVSYDPETENVITLGLGDYAKGSDRVGKTGSVTFNLEYVPFNIRGSEEKNPWEAFNGISAFDLAGANEPVWIIRNGINDMAQDSNTNFKTFGTGTANGNGAISFKILNVVSNGTVTISIPW